MSEYNIDLDENDKNPIPEGYTCIRCVLGYDDEGDLRLFDSYFVDDEGEMRHPIKYMTFYVKKGAKKDVPIQYFQLDKQDGPIQSVDAIAAPQIANVKCEPFDQHRPNLIDQAFSKPIKGPFDR